MNAFDTLRALVRRLYPHFSEDAGTEALVLMEFVLGQSPHSCPSRLLTVAEAERLEALVARRLEGEPLQYLVGEWEFMGLKFFVTPAALIPRADSETLCLRAIELVNLRGGGRVLDLCCGTGCIGISIAKYTDATVDFVDLSPEALALCGRNRERYGIAGELFCGDFFAPVKGSYDFIVCNPPYLDYVDMARLQPELRHEPSMALDGGFDGLDFYRRLSAEAPAHLEKGGVLLAEIGAKQERAVREIFLGCGMHYDVEGRARVAELNF